MTGTNLDAIIITGDVRSHLERYREMLRTLTDQRGTALIADAGGFFGSDGYYAGADGGAERSILTGCGRSTAGATR